MIGICEDGKEKYLTFTECLLRVKSGVTWRTSYLIVIKPNCPHWKDEASAPTARGSTNSWRSGSRGERGLKRQLPIKKPRGSLSRKSLRGACQRRGASSELIPLRDSARGCGEEASIGPGGGAWQPRRSRHLAVGGEENTARRPPAWHRPPGAPSSGWASPQRPAARAEIPRERPP